MRVFPRGLSFSNWKINEDCSNCGMCTGMKHTVQVDEMVNYLKRWCTKESDGNEVEGADFTTTVQHIHSVYRYLQAECSFAQLRELFQHSPAVFIEYERSENKNYTIRKHTFFLLG